MPTTSQTSFSASRSHLSTAARLTFAAAALMVATVSASADNPWTSSSLGWSGGTGTGWRSWDATKGGTFGNPWASHQSPHVAPTQPTEPAAVKRDSAEVAPRVIHTQTTEAAPSPATVHDTSIDPVMIKAGNIAEQRALSHSTSHCWRFVKQALVAAGGVDSYPQTAYAREAGTELVRRYGFVRLAVNRAERAPVGSVLVYGGYGAGHVELRTPHGFVSDYRCTRPADLPFIGAYTRLEKRHKEVRTAQIAPIAAPGS